MVNSVSSNRLLHAFQHRARIVKNTRGLHIFQGCET